MRIIRYVLALGLAGGLLLLPAIAQARYEGFTVDNDTCSAPRPGDAQYRELEYARRYGANIQRACIVWSRMGDAVYRARWSRYFRAEAALGIRAILLIWAPEADPQWPTGRPIQWPAPQAYAQAAGLAARLWSRRAVALEVMNEPNNFGEDQVAAEYMDVLRPTYQAVKHAAPRLPVLAGSIALADGPFLRALYAHGLHGNFDALSYHPYTLNLAPNDASRGARVSFKLGGPTLHRIMADNGDGDKQLWITEMGWTTSPSRRLRAYFGTATRTVTDAQRAKYMRQAATITRRWPWLACVEVYQVRNNEQPPGHYRGPRASYEWLQSGYALLTRDWQPTASLRTFARLRFFGRR